MTAVVLSLVCALSCGPRMSSEAGRDGYAEGLRKASWAQPVSMPGVPNLHRVTGNLYRSGQPTAAGMRNLERFGIATIINLRSMHSDADELEETTISYVRIPMHAWRPAEDAVVAFLKTATSEEKTPVLVHCNYGADRTGFMCALYRVVVCGWTREEALAEMVEGGFGFHAIWNGLIEYIETIDIDLLRERTGLSGSAGGATSPSAAGSAVRPQAGGTPVRSHRPSTTVDRPRCPQHAYTADDRQRRTPRITPGGIL